MTTAWAAWALAATTGRGCRRTDGLAAGAFGDKPAGRHEFAHLGAFAIWAGWGFLAKNQALELMAATFTLVFENGHVLYSLGPMDWLISSADYLASQ